MQHAMLNPPVNHFDRESNPVFNVVIAYEDFRTGTHAKSTYDYLVENLGGQCEFHNQMWKFDVLNIRKLRHLATTDAAAADIVLISCHGNELPEHVKTWIESWLAADAKPMALVALFDRPRDEAHKTRIVRDYLAKVAHRGGMEFFAQPDEWPGSVRESQEAQPDQEENLSQRTLSTLAGVVKREVSPTRWINAE